MNILRFLAQVPTFSEGSCGSGSFFNVPTWYKYLNCVNGSPQIENINDTWKIVAGVIDIFLYVAGAAAVLFMIYGGIQMIISQGAPDKLSKARQTLIYAAAGLIISIIARAAINFGIGQF